MVSKAFVDAEISKLPKPDTDVLKLHVDGSKAMTGDLDMGNKAITNIKPFVDMKMTPVKQPLMPRRMMLLILVIFTLKEEN